MDLLKVRSTDVVYEASLDTSAPCGCFARSATHIFIATQATFNFIYSAYKILVHLSDF
jgi:hypothetical protein